MRLLLTSAGIRNQSIRDALVELLGKPIAESNALCIPTGTHIFGKPELAYRSILPSLDVVDMASARGVWSWRHDGSERKSSVVPHPGAGCDETLGRVNFAIFPHLENPHLPDHTMATAEKWTSGLSTPAYAMGEETAITMVDGAVDVISGGSWKIFNS